MVQCRICHMMCLNRQCIEFKTHDGESVFACTQDVKFMISAFIEHILEKTK